MKTLGESVKSKRKLARLTQDDLAKLAGLSQSTISDIERGRNESSREVHAIATALGVTVEELMGIGRASSQIREPSLNYAPTKVRKIPVKSLAQIISRQQGSAEVSAPDTLPDRTVAYALVNDSCNKFVRFPASFRCHSAFQALPPALPQFTILCEFSRIRRKYRFCG